MNSSNITTTSNPGPLELPIVPRQIIIYSIVFFATIFNNILIIFVIVSKRRLRNVSNGLMVSMFITGCLFAILYIFPRWVYPYWTHSPFLCSILPNTGITLIICSNLHQCTISLDRFLRVTLPFNYNKVARKRYAIIAIVVIWIVSIFSGYFINMFYGFYRTDECHIYYTAREGVIYSIYYIITYSILFFLPLAITAGTYVRIFIIINSKSRQELFYKRSRVTRSTLNKNLKAAKQVVMMTGVYALCWFPFIILVFIVAIAAFAGNISSIVGLLIEIFQYFAFSYHAINPLLYAFITASVKRALINKARRCCRLPVTDRRDSRTLSTRSSFVRTNSMDLASHVKPRSNGKVKSVSDHSLIESTYIDREFNNNQEPNKL